MKTAIWWAITGKLGLYTGTWFTRTAAIIGHTDALGKNWRACRKNGDRAIKVTVTPIYGELKMKTLLILERNKL